MALNSRDASSIALKICGITLVDQAIRVARLGADAIGIIGLESSSRFVEGRQRRKIFSSLMDCAPSVERVWVTADSNDSDLDSCLNGSGTPSIVQLHGNETEERCKSLRMKYPNTRWWKAIRIREEEDLTKANRYFGAVDALLIDAWSPNDLGGTGTRLPLSWLQEKQFDLPWWLAGGISAEWVPEILSQVKPYGLDASSRIEKYPGNKDLDAVVNLVKAVKDQNKTETIKS